MGEGFYSVSNIVAGEGIDVDTTDPHNPVVSATGGGSGVQSVIGGLSIMVDDTDPANPVVSLGPSEGEDYPSITPGMGEGDDPNVYIAVSEATHLFIADAEGVEIATDQGVTIVATGNIAVQSADGDTRLDLSGAGNSLALQGAPSEYLNLTATFGVNIYTAKVFTINSTLPMKPPANADVLANLNPATYPGTLIYDTATSQLMYSNGTDWVVIA